MLTFSYTLIPDGISTIVQVEIKGDFTVSTANARDEADAAAISLLSRLTDCPESEIRQQMQDSLWTGDFERPDEPSTGREEERST